MIKVTVKKKDDGRLCQFCMDGHAGFAEHGHDIVCAAVSALFINTANAIEAFTEDTIRVDFDEKKDRVILDLPDEISDEANLLMQSLLLGLDGIRKEYHGKYIRIIYD